MSGISITIDDAELRRVLQALQRRLVDLRPAMTAIGQALVTATDLGFRAQRDPWGTPWEPLAPATLLARRRGRRQAGAQILRDTGVLQNSINYRAGRDSVAIGTNVDYAAVHQFGADIQHVARQHTLYFRQNARTGAVGNRFVRRSRSNFAQDVTIGAHATHIPARPFLPIRNGQADLPRHVLDEILAIVSRHLVVA